jgi:biotin transport system substrate-specific component
LIAKVWNQFERLKLSFFNWRTVTTITNKILLAFAFAILTGVLAQAKIYLPWTPVPITGQTIIVLMAGVILGKNWGGISQAIYILLGISGIPWFASGMSGTAALIGPTGGYLIGFVVAALFVGYAVERYLSKNASRSFLRIVGILMFANFVIIYGLGLIGLGAWMHLIKGSSISFLNLIKLGVAPFIIGDLLKLFFVSIITMFLLPNSKN